MPKDYEKVLQQRAESTERSDAAVEPGADESESAESPNGAGVYPAGSTNGTAERAPREQVGA
jgi:hypothetical protein